MRNRRTYTEEQLKLAVKESFSIADVIRKLNLIVAGANYKGINKHIKELSLDKSHFTGMGHLKGKTHTWAAKIPLETILIENSNYSHCSGLRQRLIKEGVFPYECQSCKLTEWLGKPISLELDHINGINDDNRIENLRILCPNCHAQTDTYRGKNQARKGNGHGRIRTDTGDCLRILTPAVGLRGHNNCCQGCFKPISYGSIRCKSCAVKAQNKQKIEWPSNNDLRNMIAKSSCLAVSKQLGVSDNAIRKRLKRAELSNSNDLSR